MTHPKWITGALLMAVILFPVSADEHNKEKKDKKKAAETYVIKKPIEVNVTATMSPHTVRDSSSSVAVVDAADISMSSSQSALDILRDFSGVFVSRTGDFGRADVDIRGLGGNCRQIAVLVDGKPEKMGLFGCAVSHAFPLDNVERIEVVKGPASVLYGGEALGGAVNIITGTPAGKNESDLSVMMGSYGTRQLNLRQGGDLGKFMYGFTVDRRISDGHIENSQYSGLSMTGRMAYRFTEKTSLNISAKYFSGDKHEPGPVSDRVMDLWNIYRRGAVDLTLNHEMKNGDVSFRLYRNFGNHEFSDGWDSRDYTNGGMIRYTTRGLKNHTLTVGGDLKYFGGESLGFPVGDWDKHEGSVFLHDTVQLFQKWMIQGGVRLHSDSLYGTRLCPQLGLVFQPSDASAVRANISKGFRSPQLNELFMFPASNPELKPEEVWNIELGWRHTFWNRIYIDLSVFSMQGKNMIRTVARQDPPPAIVFENTGEFEFRGIELDISLYAFKNIMVNAGYMVTDYGDYTKGKPGQKIHGAVSYRGKALQLKLSGFRVTDYFAADHSLDPIGSHTVINARLMVPVGKHINVVADVNNLLDETYFVYGEFPGVSAGLFEMPGRNFQLGIRVNLNGGGS